MAYAAGPPSRPQRDEVRGRLYGGFGKFKDTTGRGFRSLSKAFDKERYAKVEVMSSSASGQSKKNEVIVARIASFIVRLVCACQGCPHQKWALRAGFLVCGSTVDSARRAGEFCL